jgi:hypothetical protein
MSAISLGRCGNVFKISASLRPKHKEKKAEKLILS